MRTRRQPSCRLCARLRWLLVVAVLIALLPALPGVPGAQPVVQPAVPAAAPASAASSAELIYNRVRLVQLQVDKPWKGMQLVRPGKQPFKLNFDPEALPPGMAIDDKGFLSGTPTVVQDYPFVLGLEDATRSTEQRYLIRVRGPQRTPPPGPTQSLPPDSAVQKPDLPPGMPRVWMLSETDIGELAVHTEAENTAGEAQEAQDRPAPVPTEDQLKAILSPLQDREFPTEALLRHALQASVCDYFRVHVRAVAERLGRPIDATCPPRSGAPDAGAPSLHPQASRRAVELLRNARALADNKPAIALPSAAAAASGAASGVKVGAKLSAKVSPKDLLKDKPLAAFYDELLTPERAHEVVDKAVKARPIHQATPLALAVAAPVPPATACQCRAVNAADEAMGVFTYWHGAKAAQPVDFSLVSRLTWMGAEMDDNGAVQLAEPGGAPQPLAFVRAARQYGVKVDLGVHRRDWTVLRGASDKRVDELAATAAAQSWKQLQTQLTDSTAWWQGFLIKRWRDSDWAFEGLTVFFEDTLEFGDPRTREADRDRYERFIYTYLRALMQQMRRTGAADGTPTPDQAKGERTTVPRAERPYRLNVVVPDHLVLADGVFGIDRLWGVLQESERVLTQPQINEMRRSMVQDRNGPRTVHTDITVNFLVLLSDPTTDFKKWLRARLDDSRNVRGHDRVALLNSFVPVLLTRRDTQLPLGAGDKALSDDFAYARWNYGGVGLWPMPVQGRGQGSDVYRLMKHTYGAQPHWSDRICQWGCPWRVPLRLAMQTLLLSGALLLGLYWWNCRVRAVGRPIVLLLLANGLLAFLVGATLLTCDPLLQQFDLSSMLLAGGILGALGFGLWRTLVRPE